MKKILIITMVCVFGLSCGCAKKRIPSTPPGSAAYAPRQGVAPTVSKAKQKPYTVAGKTYEPLMSGHGFSEEGLASWYGKDFHGKKTASGQIYNMNLMTAAHKLLPLGTTVEVTNLDNGKKVNVLINDRGPFVQNRVIDLSRMAAVQLDMLNKGVCPVRVRTVGLVPGSEDGDIPGPFYVQVGSFSKENNAQSTLAELFTAGYTKSQIAAAWVNGNKYYRVQAGVFRGLKSAKSALDKLSPTYPGSFILAD